MSLIGFWMGIPQNSQALVGFVNAHQAALQNMSVEVGNRFARYD